METEQATFELRRALVGLDARGLARPALQAALELESRLGFRVELVHALEHLEATWIAADRDLRARLGEAAREQARERIDPVLVEWERERGLVEGELRERLSVVPGPAGQVLCEAAGEGWGTVLFLGPHQRRGWIDLGHTARRVLVGCQASIWLQPTAHRPIESILAAVDLSRDDWATLRAARELGRLLAVPVTALHALVPSGLAHLHELAEALALPRSAVADLRRRSRDRREEAWAGFDWRGVPHSLELVDEEPREALLERHDPGRLVVLGTRGQAGLATLPGNVAWSVLRDARGPVLAVRQPASRLVT